LPIGVVRQDELAVVVLVDGEHAAGERAGLLEILVELALHDFLLHLGVGLGELADRIR
jgi:hypothetical protein